MTTDFLKPLASRKIRKPRAVKIPKANRAEQEFLFHCKAYKLPQVIPQFPFALSLERKFKADFCFPIQRLLIEIQGGIHMRGRGGHSSGVGIQRDIEKMQYAALLGYVVLPFTTEEVINCHAIKWTIRVLHKLGWKI